MRILVTGGRDYSDQVRLFAELDAIHAAKPITVVIQGGAKGADGLAELWCETRGICCLRVRAPWSTHGKAAGSIRNGWMLEHCSPIDAVVAFPGGNGTANMCKQAAAKGVYIHKVE
jgi:hypothetical protein